MNRAVASARGIAPRARKVTRALVSPDLRKALRVGVLPATEHATLPFGHDFRSVIDVGASKGQFAAFALQRFTRPEVICFEPLPGPRERLARVLAGRGKIIAAAVGRTRGTAQLHVSHKSDSSSTRAIGDEQVAEFPGTHEAETITVDVVTLDDCVCTSLPRPTLLKIDTQGAELDVLHGAHNVLSRTDEVLVECSFVELYLDQPLIGDVIAFLTSRDFVLKDVGKIHRGRGGRALQVDLLFSHSPTTHP